MDRSGALSEVLPPRKFEIGFLLVHRYSCLHNSAGLQVSRKVPASVTVPIASIRELLRCHSRFSFTTGRGDDDGEKTGKST